MHSTHARLYVVLYVVLFAAFACLDAYTPHLHKTRSLSTGSFRGIANVFSSRQTACPGFMTVTDDLSTAKRRQELKPCQNGTTGHDYLTVQTNAKAAIRLPRPPPFHSPGSAFILHFPGSLLLSQQYFFKRQSHTVRLLFSTCRAVCCGRLNRMNFPRSQLGAHQVSVQHSKHAFDSY